VLNRKIKDEKDQLLENNKQLEASIKNLSSLLAHAEDNLLEARHNN